MADHSDTATALQSEQVDVIDSIEAEIAEFEKTTGEKLGVDLPARNERGQFTDTDSTEADGDDATDGERAPGEDDGAEAGSNGRPPAKSGLNKQDDTTKAEKQPAGQQKQSSEAAETNGKAKSAWAKNGERQDRSWKALNSEKETWTKQRDQEREQLKLEREQFEAQQRQSPARPPTDDKGRTAADYRQASSDWMRDSQDFARQALEAANRGDFDREDRLTRESERWKKNAANAEAMAKRLEPVGFSDAWRKLGEDMPTALDVSGPFYKQIVQMVRADQNLFGDPMGPYRAVMKLGQGEVKRLEGELQKKTTEAAKVPDLLKQIETLTAKVQELTTRTSLPGGQANLSREGSADGRSSEDMSLDDLEKWVDRDMASRV